MTVTIAVPRDDELTAEWFSEVMGEATGGATVVAARVEPMLTADVGWFGRLLRAHLDYDIPGAGPATVVAKLDPEDDFVRDIGFDLGFFGRETGFYRDLADAVPLRVPRCHHAAIDDDTRRYVIVLEDLAAGRFGNQVNGCTLDELLALTGELAALHAWGATVEPPDWAAAAQDLAPPFLDYGENLDSFTVHAREFVPDRALVAAARLGEQVTDVYAAIGALPATLSHSDFRLDNVVFDLDSRPIVYDWQSVSRTPGAGDLASLLVLSLEAEARREVEETVIASYRAQLSAHGAGVDDDEFRRGYQLGIIHFFLVGMLAFATNPTRPTFVDWARRSSHALAEIDLDSVL